MITTSVLSTKTNLVLSIPLKEMVKYETRQEINMDKLRGLNFADKITSKIRSRIRLYMNSSF